MKQLELIKEKVAKKFLFATEIAEAIVLGAETKRGVLLYGPGGHAKTALASYIAACIYGDSVSTVMFGRGSNMSMIFGGIDFAEFKSTGELRYLPERSWMGEDCAIFEEFLDAPDAIIESLKFVLSERRFPRHGGDYPLKTQLVIGCTNHNPTTWASTESQKALLGRFPIQLEVKWPRYTFEDFTKLFEFVFKDKLELVAEAIIKCHEMGCFISPRDAVYIGEQYTAYPTLGVFKYMDRVIKTPGLMSEIQALETMATYRSRARAGLNTAKENLKKIPIHPTGTYEEASKMYTILSNYEKYIRAIVADGSFLREVNEVLALVRERVTRYQGYLQSMKVDTGADEFQLPAL